MRHAIAWKAEDIVSPRLQEELRVDGWSLETCDGMLELLRLVENNGYDLVILNVGHPNVEVHTLLGAIEALGTAPRILLVASEYEGALPSSIITLNYPLIRGELTGEKILEAAKQNTE